ncbi:MAG: aminotransferase class V-fold PLP-dependent enzyme [Candidatus Korarchaeum sp.]
MREDLLSEFPALGRYVYLNTASIGLVPKRTIDAIREFSERLMTEGAAYLDEGAEESVFEGLRLRASELLGCSEEEIAVFSSVTEAINSIAWALKRGGRVLSTSLEFPSVIYPWMRIGREKGWEMEIFEPEGFLIDEGELLSKIRGGLRAVCLSHVEFLTGQRLDLRAIAERAHEVGALMIVDGIQAAGCIPVDVKALDVDVYITGSYKWLLGPMGAAVAYIRRDLAEELEPGIVGWRSVRDMWALDTSGLSYAEAARRFEYGTSSYDAKVGLAKSLEYLLELGVNRIHDQDMRVSGKLLEELSNLARVSPITPAEGRGPIVTVRVDGVRPEDLLRSISGEGRSVVASVRRGFFRFSVHLYNDSDDVEELAERLSKAIRGLR